jgi:hypothetical protein
MADADRAGLIGSTAPKQACKGRVMTNPVPNPAALEERVTGLADILNNLIGVVSRLDNETSDTAAAAFDSDVPRVAGHKATAAQLKSLSNTLDAWLKEWRQTV